MMERKNEPANVPSPDSYRSICPQNRSMGNGTDGWEAGVQAGWKNEMKVESTWVDTGKEESINRKIDG